MSSDLQVVNKALRHLGRPPIESIADNRGSDSRILKDSLDASIRSVLGANDWTANRASESSTGVERVVNDDKYLYRHDLSALANPLDTIVWISDDYGSYLHQYQQTGDNLDASAKIITIAYTYVIDTVANMPEYLASLIAAHLAMESCMALTGDGNKYYVMERIYTREFRKARSQEFRMNPQGFNMGDANTSSFIATHQGL